VAYPSRCSLPILRRAQDEGEVDSASVEEEEVQKILGICLAVVALLLPLWSFAQTSPLELVRSFYVPGFDEDKLPFSPRLSKLLDAAIANSKKHNAPVTGLDFSWILNAQDAEPGFDKTLKFAELKRSATDATVRVSFTNGREEELLYELKQQNGKWVVDDIRYLKGTPTSLAKMLETGAKETP
jgi:hypothetical protein